jgi:hypothetical protein
MALPRPADGRVMREADVKARSAEFWGLKNLGLKNR